METLVKKYFLCKITQLEMIQDRGLLIDDEEKYLLDDSIQKIEKLKTFYRKILENPNINSKIYTDKEKTRKTAVYFYFETDPTQKIVSPKEFVKFYEKNVTGFILILNNPEGRLTNELIEDKIIKENLGYEYSIFNLDNLTVNPTKHFLVPRHELLSKEEKERVLKELNLTIDKIPRILKEDPIAEYYGAKVGDLFRIYRTEMFYPEIVEEQIIYRSVTIIGEIEKKKKKK
jgi:DNA-directed RNA polymerase I, II, and III subunit RPABC1